MWPCSGNYISDNGQAHHESLVAQLVRAPNRYLPSGNQNFSLSHARVIIEKGHLHYISNISIYHFSTPESFGKKCRKEKCLITWSDTKYAYRMKNGRREERSVSSQFSFVYFAKYSLRN